MVIINPLIQAELPTSEHSFSQLTEQAGRYKTYVKQITPLLELVSLADHRIRELPLARPVGNQPLSGPTPLQLWSAFVHQWQVTFTHANQQLQHFAPNHDDLTTYQSYQQLRSLHQQFSGFLVTLKRWQFGLIATEVVETQQQTLLESIRGFQARARLLTMVNKENTL